MKKFFLYTLAVVSFTLACACLLRAEKLTPQEKNKENFPVKKIFPCCPFNEILSLKGAPKIQKVEPLEEPKDDEERS